MLNDPANIDGYIEKWQLHHVVNEAVLSVLNDQPADPYAALAAYFAKLSPNAAKKQKEQQQEQEQQEITQVVRNCGHRLTKGCIQAEEVAALSEADVRVLVDACSQILASKRALKGFFTHGCGVADGPESPMNSRRRKKAIAYVEADALNPEFLQKLLRIALELGSNVTQADELLKVIIESSQELLSADRCSLFVRQGDELVTQIKRDEVIRVHVGTGLAGHCAETGETINLSNAYTDPRFNRTVDDQTGYRTVSLLCAPIICDREVVAVAQLLNKLAPDGSIQPFTSSDLALFKTYAAFAGLAIHNAELYMEQAALTQKNQFFISVIEKLSQVDMRNWVQVVDDVSVGAREVLQAERCTLFVVDKELNELRARGEAGEIRFAAWKGVAGHVYSTGKILNITHPYSDPRFNPEVDKATGFITRSLLTMPVKHRDEVVAVVQVVNKKDREGFTAEDEETLRYFAHFAGVTLNNSNLYDFVLDSRNKAMALFERQLQVLGTPSTPKNTRATFTVSTSDLEDLLQTEIEPMELEVSKTLEFDIHAYAKSATLSAAERVSRYNKLVLICEHLFEEMNFPRTFGFSREKILRFICSVRQKYRSVPYHSFVHACDVLQTVFTYLTIGRVQELLTTLDCFVLMVSALLHDIDHMGLNNSFHFKTESPLGILSSASGAISVLEVHHCHVSLQLLEVEELNIFSGVPKEMTQEAYRGLISNILSTDMNKHVEIMEQLKQVGCGYQKSHPEHRRLLCNLLLKAADISNVSKPFEISRRWGLSVTEEFHRQGDVEKNEGYTPAPMFDRSAQQELAKGQVGFIDAVAGDLFRSLTKACPYLQWPSQEVSANRAQWASIIEKSQDLNRGRQSLTQEN